MLEIDHPTNADLAALLRQKLAPTQECPILVHLAACASCRSILITEHGVEARQYLADVFGPVAVRRWSYEIGSRSGGYERDLVASYRMLEELDEASPAHGKLLITNRRAYQSQLGAVSLMEEARRQWRCNPGRAARTIDAAKTVLEKLLPTSPIEIASQLARCWAIKANIFRLRGCLQDAEAALSEAKAWLKCTVAGPKLEKEIQIYEGLIYRERYAFAQAITSLEEALEAPGPTGGQTMRMEAAITLAITYWEHEQPQTAIKTVENLLNKYSRSELGEFLYLAALQNLARWQTYAGNPETARDMLPAIKELVSLPEHALLRVRVTWLEAEICRTEGNRPAAASLYREAQQGFADFDLPYDTALVSLDLAHLHLEAGDSLAARELAEELIPIFKARDIHRKATAAGMVLVDALRHEEATAAQVRDVAAIFLRRGQLKGAEPFAESRQAPEPV